MEGTEMSLQMWIVQAVSLGIMSTLGFLLKNSFTKIERQLEVIQLSVNALTGDHRAVEVEIRSLNHRVTALEEEVRDLRLKG